MHEYPGMSRLGAFIATMSMVLGVFAFAGLIALITQI